jgi:hypothetical protein
MPGFQLDPAITSAAALGKVLHFGQCPVVKQMQT